MTRRLLERRAAWSCTAASWQDEMRAAGFAGPVAVIPHGAWIPEADRNGYRHKLGLDEATPLIGIFGFLKPYKRIAESLRAFRRLVRLAPNARMILVGEPHPEFPLEAMIRSHGPLGQRARAGLHAHRGFRRATWRACDIVLNLRYPTVGESSGTLLRVAGAGQSGAGFRVGSFQEFPDDVCLKVPVGAGEEDLIFEYLNLLVSRPDVAQALGAARAATRWRDECNWAAVARAVRGVSGSGGRKARKWQAVREPPVPPNRARRRAGTAVPQPSPSICSGWAHRREASRGYLETHQTRLVKTLEITPPGGPDDRILEMGAYLQITPALRTKLGYGEVRGCYYGKLGRIDHRAVTSAEGETFECDIDHFDAEKDRFPYPDEHFSTVLCCELIEHLFEDPMHLMTRGQPHPEARRAPGADHAQHRGAARHRGHPAGLSSRLLPRLHPAGANRAKWTRATTANTRRARSTSCWRIPASRWRASRPASSATSRIPSSAGCCTCWSGIAWTPTCAATASTPWAARPGRCASAIPAWLYS